MDSDLARMRSYLKRLSGIIVESGWAVQGVMGDPPFAYTVGLSGLGHPELLVVGLPMEAAQSVLNTIAQEVRDGRQYTDGEQVSGLLQGEVPLRFESIDPAGVVTMATALYDEVRALQVLWPDKDGRFPGEPGCTVERQWNYG